MRGSYSIMTEAGEPFDIEIPEFSLHLPGAAKQAHGRCRVLWSANG